MRADVPPVSPDLRLTEALLGPWMRRHPGTVDWLVVVICTGLQGIPLAFAGEPISWTRYAIPALAAAALLWRRHHPLAVLTVVTSLAAAGLLIHPDLAPQGLPSAFALFAVATRQPTGRAILGYLIAVGLPAVAGLILVLGSGARFSPSILDPLCLAALATGFAVRAWTERRKALADLIRRRAEHAALAERAQITAEMHDVVAHSLTVMVALAGGARAAWDRQPERARDALDKLTDVGAGALAQMQRILGVLRSDDPEPGRAWDTSGHSIGSLDDLAHTFRSAGLPVTIVRRGSAEIPDPSLATTVHRIVQEALTNALRYAEEPTRVVVRLDAVPDAIEVTITDDGCAARRPPVGAGVGLTSIRERAAAFGGTSAAGPLEGGGWRVHARLPIDREDRP